MSFKGLSMSDFSSQEEAFKVADEIIAANKVEFEHDGVAKLSPSGNPLLDEFFFVLTKRKDQEVQPGRAQRNEPGSCSKEQETDSRSRNLLGGDGPDV